MLLSDAVIQFFPEVVTPDLIRKKSQTHWRTTRNKTKREKAAVLLTDKKKTTIRRQLIHGKEDFPVLDISDDEVDICLTKKYLTVTIDVSNRDLLTHNIEVTGDCCRENMVCLIASLLDQLADQI